MSLRSRSPRPATQVLTRLGVGALAVSMFSVPWGIDVRLGSLRWLTVVSLPLLLAVACWLFGSGRLPRLRAPDLAVLALAGWAVASLRWTVSPRHTWYAIDGYVLAALAFVTIRQLPQTRRQRRVVGAAFLAGTLLTCVALIVNAAFGWGPPGRPRAFGLNPNYISYTLAAAATLVLTRAPRLAELRRLRSNRVARAGRAGTMAGLLTGGAVLAVLLLGIWLTGTRGSLIALALAALVVAARRWVRLELALATVVFVGLFAVFLFAVPTDLLVGIDSASSRATGDLSGRLSLWPYAQQVIGENWLLGVGAGAFAAVNPFRVGAHNLALGVTAELGLVGATLYLLFVLLLVVEVGRAGRRTCAAALAGVLVGWLPIAFSGQWDYAAVPFVTFALASVLDLPDRSDRRAVDESTDTGPLQPRSDAPVGGERR